ncbi:MAG: hypothetical protein B9S32_01000 [Verrucomicrobia bacterium Tous-C9LFEB]|nr:MAG: hypothetical protein B9S32_01000 [Verrucomicrobia bacterium Tous-C9LFEB]
MVEMLVVMVIAVILVALLLPALWRLQAGAQSAKCQSLLRQIGVALTTYSADHEGALPKVYDSKTQLFWFHQLMGGATGSDGAYLNWRQVLICPGSKGRASMFTPPRVVGYGMLDAYLWYPTTHRSQEEPRLMLKIRKLAEWPLIMDANYPAVYSLDNPVEGAATDSRFDARHNHCANILMADGHIEQAAYGDKQWNQGNLNKNIQ